MLISLGIVLLGIIVFSIFINVKSESIDDKIRGIKYDYWETVGDLDKHIHCIECGKTIIPHEYKICKECLRKKGIETLNNDPKYLYKEKKND